MKREGRSEHFGELTTSTRSLGCGVMHDDAGQAPPTMPERRPPIRSRQWSNRQPLGRRTTGQPEEADTECIIVLGRGLAV